MTFLAYQQVNTNTVTSQTVSAFTVPVNTSYVFLQADIAGQVRYTLSGNTPTNTTGMILAPNTAAVVVTAAEFQSIKFIAGNANTAINVHYQR